MMEKYFEKYGDSIISFNFVAKIKTIHFWISDSWTVPEHLLPDTMEIQYDKSTLHNDDKKKYYCILYVVIPEVTDEKSDIVTKLPTWDEMYTVIESIFEFNLDKERKDNLLKERISELQEQFSKHTLDELSTMKFS